MLPLAQIERIECVLENQIARAILTVHHRNICFSLYAWVRITTNWDKIWYSPLCVAYGPLAVVADGSHFAEPTPTPNDNGPMAFAEAMWYASKITLNHKILDIFSDFTLTRITNTRMITLSEEMLTVIWIDFHVNSRYLYLIARK